MASIKLYLDTRGLPDGAAAPLKLSISHKGAKALLSLGLRVKPGQWDKNAGQVTAGADRQVINSFITGRKHRVDLLLLELIESGEIARMDAHEIKRRAAAVLMPEQNAGKDSLFASRFMKFASAKKQRTKEIYLLTYKRLEAYAGAALERLRFEDITKQWLEGFEAFLSLTAPSKNARNIHLRNIRAVFNDAIDDEVTTAYPFRRFKIRPVATPKRSLAVEQLRELFSYPVEPHVEKYLDMFKLIFFLAGINIADLCRLKGITDGRIEYYRAKTGRLYSIKVEPEAAEIIERYRGSKYLLDPLDRYANYKDYAKKLNMNLQRIGMVRREGRGGKKIVAPLFPNLTTYWARHSWATMAAQLDIPKETIAAALGHGGNTVTDIYIDFDRRKIDEANRRVIDWVLYGKR